MQTIPDNDLSAGILGVIVGDALGLPVQFEEREERDIKPVTEMIGYGVFNVPSGSWSDDSSLTLCLVDALTKVSPHQRQQFLQQLGQNFCQWLDNGYLTPFGYAYDVGGATYKAVSRLQKGVSPLESGSKKEYDNGNGSLMRILPLAYYYQQFSPEELINLTHEVGSITHGHLRANIACGIYITIAVQLLQGKSPHQAYTDSLKQINTLYSKPIYQQELAYYHRILAGNIQDRSRDEIKSTGYVVDTLEASLWCLLTTNNYEEAVLKAGNLEKNTDTVGAVTGGLAGIYYGLKNIPEHWLSQIQKLDEIIDLMGLWDSVMQTT
ncbi:MAG: ADP-ribosylglycohydrolase family protein [Cyanobacteria bacterium]|nr:ADP-ribosylglycohydrolase family protein [Cyanobacteria bacterium CG_2015-16_32_12]NCO78354.1 ADP-ribosylglycohydrolase family protein [Cyanobacteria bacterium CG_2015-22_32_23]NCQ05331.1 ADP-ribosylglycohydrolase family protein [Cyanobacteria bacterium CG_2015-09_32_10]NCQ41212.1 ADP-ribosylglycohydrolase family protein [Cyanobacteria bacterium CG_2015-04_32_10]NCS84112.1 ADP-ribosylglycohydrolase family protein [Cyanobacteria bacterium CG_2015-02_32_10]